MKDRNPKLFIKDIIIAMDKIDQYISGFDYQAFLNSNIVMDAVERNLEIIGEAAKFIPEEMQQKYPELPVSDMIGMRNILIHNYLGVSYQVVWETAKNVIPQIKLVLIKIYENEF